MIKRRFYKIDHGDRDASDASSSSSDEDHDNASEELDEDEVHSISSGYKSEDSSANDVDDVNSAGQLFSEDDAGAVNEEPMLINKELPSECDSEKSNVLDEKKPLVLPREMQFYVLKFKSVFKCRICPRVICLTEDTLRVHLQSKRHARSEKLHKEGRLKVMLNSDGETEILSEDSEDEKNDKGLTQQKKKFRKNVKKTSTNQGVSEVQFGDSEDDTEKNDKLTQQKKKFRKKVKKTSLNQDVSEIQSEDSEDNTEKNDEGLKQHKKKFMKKKSDNANKWKKQSTKGSDKRRRKNEN